MNALSDIRQLSVDDLKKLLDEFPLCENEASSDAQALMQLQVVDVRTSEEHRYLGYIPGALLMPLHTLPERQGELDRKKTTVLVCEHGVRSMDASLYLWHLGFRNLANLTHGMATWPGPRN